MVAVVELDDPVVVDDEAGVVGVATGVQLHDGEAAPDLVVDAGLLEGGHLRPVEPAHDGGVGVHREPVQGVFGGTPRGPSCRGCGAPWPPCRRCAASARRGPRASRRRAAAAARGRSPRRWATC